MKNLILYHANCNDGFGAAWAAATSVHLHMEHKELYAISHGEPVPFHLIDKETDVHILDFSFDVMTTLNICSAANNVAFLDHHKTAIEKFKGWRLPENCIAVLDTTRSGAMLAWDYYHDGEEVPVLIQYIQDRDLWTKEMDSCDEFHLNLSTHDKTVEKWNELVMETNTEIGLYGFLLAGHAIKRYYHQTIASIIKNCKGICRIDEKVGLGVNCNGMFASDIGHILATESGTFGCTYENLANGDYKVSLRSNGDYDISAIAKSFGGGGHKNAAGFVVRRTDEDALRRLSGSL